MLSRLPGTKVRSGELMDFENRIVAASLQPQLYVLLRESELCGSVNTAYWTGLVEAIFALGSIAGRIFIPDA